MMKRLLIISIIAIVPFLSVAPVQAQGGECPSATIEHVTEGSWYRLSMSSESPVLLTSVTLNWSNGAILTYTCLPGVAECSHPLDSDGSHTVDTNITLDSSGYYVQYGFSGFMDLETFSYSCTTEQVPTATPVITPTPIPTGTPEPYNEWGRALSETAFVSDFNATMAAANGGTPLDMTPYEIPTASASLPALTLSVADLNTMGKSATTLWALLDQFDVLPFYFLIAIALAVVWWLYRFITDLPTPTPELDFTGAIDVGTGFDDLDIESGLASEEDFRANNKKYGYDDSLARTEALKDRKARNAKRRSLAHGGVSLIRRTRKLF